MSRSHVTRPDRTVAPTKPTQHTAAPPSSTPVNTDAHARYGHHFSQITPTPAEDSAPIQREADETDTLDTGEEMQLKSEGGVPARPNVPAAGGVGGSPLPPPVRGKMETSFGHSFADVRVHSGSEAETVGALAYTRGTDIHFQPGLYDPSSSHGQELLGHELTHVVQQSAGRVASPGGAGSTAPINADTSLEAEADAMGRQAAQGEAAPVTGAGGGIQRKAMSDAPIQRDEDEDEEEAPKYYQMDAPKKPNEFLPSRLRPQQLANNSPERSKVRHNSNGSVFQPDVARVNTFRSRMAGEMTAQKNMLATNDEAAQFPTDPLAKPGPAGWGGFVADQQAATRAELSALSAGTTTGGSVIERNGAPNNWTPRPAATRTPLAPIKAVTQGTTEGTTAYNGGDGDKVNTLSGPNNANTSRLGWLENRLNNPSQSPGLVDNHNSPRFPREPMAARQQHLIQTAEKADPLMRDLDDSANNNTLPHHVDKDSRLDNGYLFPGDQVAGGNLANPAAEPYYAVGAQQFTNVQKLLPTLSGPHVAPNVNNETRSRTNLWSEADVDPVKVNSSWMQNGGIRANLGNRGTDRLLHTAANSQAETQNGRGGTSLQPIDYRYQVTNDHYKTAVPISPVAEDYKKNLPANQQYPLPYGDTGLATGAAGPTRTSLQVQDAKANKLSKQAAAVDNDLRFQASEPYREQAGADAKQGSRVRDNEERQRNTMDGLIEDELYNQAGKDAQQGSRVRANEERKRNTMDGLIEDEAYNEAHRSALAANVKREAEEEARTQADLKALAPSDSIQSMYGMGKSGAEKWAAQQMEQQHLGVQEFLKSGEAKEPVAPMSEAADSMYG